jgi:hypothetical protein
LLDKEFRQKFFETLIEKFGLEGGPELDEGRELQPYM